MFSELFNGEVIYSKRYKPAQRSMDIENKAGDVIGSSSTTLEEYMRQADENSVYVIRPDRIEKAKVLIEASKQFAGCYEIGIDIVDHKFFCSVMLYITVAMFASVQKTELTNLLALSDEVSFDVPDQGGYEMQLTMKIYTHDLYYHGRRKKFC